jgi:Leucine-rich repeat (LRR) protein
VSPWFLKLAKPVAKLLGNLATAGLGGDAAGELADHALKSAAERAEDKRVKAQLDAVGAAFVRTLAERLDFPSDPASLNVEAVAFQVEATLLPALTASFFLKNGLNAAKIERAIRKEYPLPPGQLNEAETTLYDRALEESIAALIGTAHKLKGFAALGNAEQLKRLDELTGGMGALVTEFRQMRTDVSTVAHGVESTRRKVDRMEGLLGGLHERLMHGWTAYGFKASTDGYLGEYLNAVADTLDELELFGVDLTPESKKQKLSVAYISLSLEAGNGEDEVGPTPVVSVFDAVGKESRRLLIRGEAGSGKSTLFRWAAIQAASPRPVEEMATRSFTTAFLHVSSTARAKWEEPTSDNDVQQLLFDQRQYGAWVSHWRFAVPFLIPLRNCPKGTLPPIESFPLATVPMLRRAPDGWVHNVLQSGRALVLIDGLDEVPKKYRAEVRAQLKQLVSRYPECFYVLSTRPAALEPGELVDLNFREATVAPMSETDRGLLIDRWHDAVRTQILKTRGEAEATKLNGMAEALKAQLRDNPPIARLATNPLLAAMVCALHRDRNRKLPDDLHELAEALCHMLLYRRERESGLDLSEFNAEYRDLTYPQRKAIVAHLAKFMVEEEISAISEKHARDVIAQALYTIKGRKRSEAPAILKGLIERSGILRQKAPGMVDFIHNAFKEYLAAGRFVREQKFRSLAKRATSADWENVLLFAAAAPDDHDFATNLISEILPDDDEGKANSRRKAAPHPATVQAHARRLTAIRLRAVAQHLDPALDARLAKLAKLMLPPKTLSEAATLAAIGSPAVRFLKYSPNMAAKKAIACIRALRLIGTDAARIRLSEYAAENTLEVLAELSQAINPLEIPEVCRRITLEDPRLPDSIRAQITDAAPLRNATGLSRLDLAWTNVADIRPLAGLRTLTTLKLHATKVADISPLRSLTALRELFLGDTPVADIAALANLQQLTALYLHATKVVDASPLVGLTHLKVLTLGDTDLEDVSPLTTLTLLTRLSIGGKLVADVASLSRLTGLSDLDMEGTGVSDVTPISGLTNLERLNLSGTPVSDVSPLRGLTKLTSLHLTDTKTADISPLAALTSLEYLTFSGTQVTDLSPLSALTNLKKLYLDRLHLNDVSPLAGLTNLNELYLENARVSDPSPLTKLTGLVKYVGPSLNGNRSV